MPKRRATPPSLNTVYLTQMHRVQVPRVAGARASRPASTGGRAGPPLGMAGPRSQTVPFTDAGRPPHVRPDDGYVALNGLFRINRGVEL